MKTFDITLCVVMTQKHKCGQYKPIASISTKLCLWSIWNLEVPCLSLPGRFTLSSNVKCYAKLPKVAKWYYKNSFSSFLLSCFFFSQAIAATVAATAMRTELYFLPTTVYIYIHLVLISDGRNHPKVFPIWKISNTHAGAEWAFVQL